MQNLRKTCEVIVRLLQSIADRWEKPCREYTSANNFNLANDKNYFDDN